MLKTTLKSMALCAALVSGITPMTAALAQEDGDMMYERYYFDDAEMTIQVGYERDTCNYYGIGSTATQGRYGPYVQYNPIARCVNGQLQPY